MKNVLFTVSIVIAGFSVSAQHTILGKWKSIDDKTGETKSVVEIFERGGLVYGKVIKIFPKPGDDQDPVCNKCPEDDDRFKKKILGMEIIQGMKKNGAEYSDGHILDPEAGKVYRCKLWLESNDLKVRGYWGPVWRTQTWKKVS
ncbi:MAG TPA: DUF2147 domain-containing protein [Cyclobacteriaceae bacterium]|nr:DUF2147 domain-containing protein [Cyclobacteriaceae bacterium]HRJ82395.1 DUF2147 domain-containing protein [Cyclobacteriaceae bacterium]